MFALFCLLEGSLGTCKNNLHLKEKEKDTNQTKNQTSYLSVMMAKTPRWLKEVVCVHAYGPQGLNNACKEGF